MVTDGRTYVRTKLVVKSLSRLKTNLNFQIPLCTADQLNCVSSIKVDTSECLQQCSGIMITSKTENRLLSVVSEMVQFLRKNNRKFKKIAKKFPGSCTKLVILQLLQFNSGLKTKSNVKEQITKLSAKYWNYKGFYKFPKDFKGLL